MSPTTHGQMLASLIVELDAAELGASLAVQKDRRESADRRMATRAGRRRTTDGATSARAVDVFRHQRRATLDTGGAVNSPLARCSGTPSGAGSRRE